MLACAGCAHPAAPATNDKNLQAFEAYWQPLVPLYGQARFYENCGTRPPAWFSAVSYGLTDRITRQAKRLWSDEDAPQSYFDRNAAFDPVARAIHTEVASAHQTPVTTCETPGRHSLAHGARPDCRERRLRAAVRQQIRSRFLKKAAQKLLVTLGWGR